jgi:putative ABC transport system substrate-binding protein
VFLDAFRDGLKDAGFVEGKNLTIDFRWERSINALAGHAADLVKSEVDVIFAFTTPATKAVANATRTIPIIFTMVSDPIGSGFVVSLPRPGGNITGVTNVFPDLSGKLLETLREAVPGVRRVAVVWNPDNPGKALDFRELEAAARVVGVTLQSHHVRADADFPRAFEAVTRDRPDALVTLAETLTYLHRAEIAAFALKYRLPTAVNLSGHVEAGALMSYSISAAGIHRRAGALTGKVLAGARPADLPVERPTTFEFAINLKTAKVLGLSIPQTLLLRADHVIQ